MTTHYTRSDGTKAVIADMEFNHLASATKKLEAANRPDRDEELTAMQTRLALLQEQFRAKVEALGVEGFRAWEFGGLGWVITDPAGTQVTGHRKTEAAAWALAISRREAAE